MSPEELLDAFTEEVRNQPRHALLLVPQGREEDALMLSPETVWTLIGQLHLALRHPLNTGSPRDKTEAFEQGLDERYDI